MTSTNKAARAVTRKPPAGAIKAYIASLTGTSLEYYDFAIYSVASALVFPKIFFPGNDEFVALILSFSTFAVGYFARPIGGVIFGRLGDKIGRKYVLVFTLLLIGAATVLIGALPDYSVIGLAAPIILVLLRLAQGIGVGGEWGGAVLLSSEFGDPNRRGFWSSAAQIGPPAGNLMANGVLAILAASLSDQAFLSWGWRVAFLSSAVLVVFGLLIRLKLEETPVFKAIQAQGDRPKAPIKEVFTTQPRALIAASLSRICPDILYSLFTVFVAVYATKELGMTTGNVLSAILIGSAFQLFLIPLAGALTDRFNRRWVYGIAAAATAAYIPVFFLMIQGKSVGMLILGAVIGLALHAFMYGPQAAFITEQFPARLRYAGSSLAYTLAGVIGGGFAPVIFTLLYGGGTGGWYLIAVYILVAAIVTIVGMLLGRDPKPEEDVRLMQGTHAQPAA
ncbi:MFS family permease [Paenarthrobacter nicotinovorans]|uniref:MFS transporter n=1 Tax=Micrococcaceae TaxID=1268 RepID=UPI00087646FC|nr:MULTISPECIES: MFS transporter [Micrococcaceae]MDR6438274.1 MFS family permease [Paenarthrobacter nicotinovorans]SCZ52832.1 Sugar phosphate permease [Arthrobacter sp. UNCCL28]